MFHGWQSIIAWYWSYNITITCSISKGHIYTVKRTVTKSKHCFYLYFFKRRNIQKKFKRIWVKGEFSYVLQKIGKQLSLNSSTHLVKKIVNKTNLATNLDINVNRFELQLSPMRFMRWTLRLYIYGLIGKNMRSCKLRRPRGLRYRGEIDSPRGSISPGSLTPEVIFPVRRTR